MDKETAADLERFWSFVDTSGGPDACWPWTRSRNRHGYGQFYPRVHTGTRKAYAHRWLLGVLRGQPLKREPVGIEDACHRCDNPPCCNPAHLYVGTRKRNISDAVERSRLWQQRVTHCPKGHEYTYNPSGRHRRCKECELSAQRAKRMADRTHCKNGHPLAGDNLLLAKNGTRMCHACMADRTRRRRTRLQTAFPQQTGP